MCRAWASPLGTPFSDAAVTWKPQKSPLPGAISQCVRSLQSSVSRFRFGVRPLPKRQMVLKLKEIFQYTHQTLESDSDDSCQALCGQACATKASEASRVAGCAQPDATTGLVPQTSKGPAKIKGPQSLKQQRRAEFASEGIPGGPDGDIQLSASQESTAASVASSDTSFSSRR